MLRAKSQTRPYSINISPDIIMIDDSCATGRGDEASYHRHGGSFASTIVTQESCDLTLVHVEGDVVDRYFVSIEYLWERKIGLKLYFAIQSYSGCGCIDKHLHPHQYCIDFSAILIQALSFKA